MLNSIRQILPSTAPSARAVAAAVAASSAKSFHVTPLVSSLFFVSSSSTTTTERSFSTNPFLPEKPGTNSPWPAAPKKNAVGNPPGAIAVESIKGIPKPAKQGVADEKCGTLPDEDDDFSDMVTMVDPKTGEWGGPTKGGSAPEPTRFGDWERKGRCTDFS